VKKFILCILFLASFAQANELKRSDNLELSYLLGTMRTLFESKEFPYIRIIESSEEIMECGGTFESCPNSRLFIVSSMGDLGEAPLLYELPKSKGWKVSSNEIVNGERHLTLITTLEHSNVSMKSRSKWQSKTYKIRVSADYGMLYTVQ